VKETSSPFLLKDADPDIPILTQAKPSTRSSNSRDSRRDCDAENSAANAANRAGHLIHAASHVLLKPMARQCKVCVSASHRKIDRLLLEGQSFAKIGRRFGVSEDSLRRHFRSHVERALQKHAAAERESLQRGARLQEQLEFISAKAEDILEQAQRAGNLSVALQALRELRESCRLAAVAAGELDEGNRTTVNVQINQPADEARDARAYLEACNVPADLLNQVMAYISGKPSLVIEGQTE
jgi:hypothetical protein